MVFLFIKSNDIKIELSDEDKKQLSTFDKIQKAIKLDSVVAFDIFRNSVLVGFAMLRDYGDGYFLWDYAIDSCYQGKGFGTNALKELLIFLKDNYGTTEVSTTYLWGNERAKYVYKKVGFIETDIIREKDIHEVNMRINY